MRQVKFDENKEHLINFHNPNLWMHTVKDADGNYPSRIKIDAPLIIGVVLVLATIGFCIFKMR